MKFDIKIIHKLIKKIIDQLNHDLDLIDNFDSRNNLHNNSNDKLKSNNEACNIKKNILDALNKIIIIMGRLNQLEKNLQETNETEEKSNISISNNDLEIINNFIKRYQNNK